MHIDTTDSCQARPISFVIPFVSKPQRSSSWSLWSSSPCSQKVVYLDMFQKTAAIRTKASQKISDYWSVALGSGPLNREASRTPHNLRFRARPPLLKSSAAWSKVSERLLRQTNDPCCVEAVGGLFVRSTERQSNLRWYNRASVGDNGNKCATMQHTFDRRRVYTGGVRNVKISVFRQSAFSLTVL